jgi:hypothetical protein
VAIHRRSYRRCGHQMNVEMFFIFFVIPVIALVIVFAAQG